MTRSPVPDLNELARFRVDVEQWPTEDLGRAIADIRQDVEAGTASLETWMRANVFREALSERKRGRAA